MNFEIKGVKYQASKLCAMDQGKVYKRLVPCITALSGLFNDAAKILKNDKADVLDIRLDKGASALGNMFTNLKDEDYEYVVMNMLRAIERETGNGTGYSSVVVGDSIMFDDINENIIIQLSLVWKALVFNFSDVMSMLPSGSAGVLSKLKTKLNGLDSQVEKIG
jgi:hypothetical protein